MTAWLTAQRSTTGTAGSASAPSDKIHTIVGSILKSAVKNRLLNHNPCGPSRAPKASAAATGDSPSKT